MKYDLTESMSLRVRRSNSPADAFCILYFLFCISYLNNGEVKTFQVLKTWKVAARSFPQGEKEVV